MKKIGLLVAFLLIAFATYCLGYYKGVNDTAFLLSTTRALVQLHTISYIDQGKFENQKK